MIKKFLATVMIFLPLFVGSVSAQSTTKLGHLDSNALFMQLPELKEVQTKLEELQNQYDAEMKRMQDEYTRKVSEYQQGESKWDETIKKNRMDELKTLNEKMENYYQSAQSMLTQKAQEYRAPLQEKVINAIKAVGAENGYTYIFDSNALLFKADNANDLTDLVLKKLGVSSSTKK